LTVRRCAAVVPSSSAWDFCELRYEGTGQPVFRSLFMKNQDQASSTDREKRLRLLGEFKRIRDGAAGEPEGDEGEMEGDEPRELSPSSRFFLTK